MGRTLAIAVADAARQRGALRGRRPAGLLAVPRSPRAPRSREGAGARPRAEACALRPRHTARRARWLMSLTLRWRAGLPRSLFPARNPGRRERAVARATESVFFVIFPKVGTYLPRLDLIFVIVRLQLAQLRSSSAGFP